MLTGSRINRGEQQLAFLFRIERHAVMDLAGDFAKAKGGIKSLPYFVLVERLDLGVGET